LKSLSLSLCPLHHASVTKQDTLGWGPNNSFRFPKRGGTGQIYKHLYEHLPSENFRFNKKVVAIDAKEKCITFADGSTQLYSKLITTMPLDITCRITTGLDTKLDLQAESTKFRKSASHIIGFGITGSPPEQLKTKCWMYFPEDNCPFYRVTVFSNYSDNHVPEPGKQWSLMCEVSESVDKEVDMKTILQEAEQGLLNTKLISPDDEIVSRFHKRLEYGYPTPFSGRDQLCDPLFELLERHDIQSRGRFGAWKYEVSNQDHTLMQGVEAVDAALFQAEEMTFRFPGIVNRFRDRPNRAPYTGAE
jgi:protoporphyrinogen oxidase